jgi:hypothetical protein
VWSPGEGANCQVELNSLEELRERQRGFEERGRCFSDSVGALFKSPELRRYELARPLPGLAPVDDLPPDVRRLLGWQEGEPSAPGAYPFRPSSIAR